MVLSLVVLRHTWTYEVVHAAAGCCLQLLVIATPSATEACVQNDPSMLRDDVLLLDLPSHLAYLEFQICSEEKTATPQYREYHHAFFSTVARTTAVIPLTVMTFLSCSDCRLDLHVVLLPCCCHHSSSLCSSFHSFSLHLDDWYDHQNHQHFQ